MASAGENHRPFHTLLRCASGGRKYGYWLSKEVKVERPSGADDIEEADELRHPSVWKENVANMAFEAMTQTGEPLAKHSKSQSRFEENERKQLQQEAQEQRENEELQRKRKDEEPTRQQIPVTVSRKESFAWAQLPSQKKKKNSSSKKLLSSSSIQPKLAIPQPTNVPSSPFDSSSLPPTQVVEHSSSDEEMIGQLPQDVPQKKANSGTSFLLQHRKRRSPSPVNLRPFSSAPSAMPSLHRSRLSPSPCEVLVPDSQLDEPPAPTRSTPPPPLTSSPLSITAHSTSLRDTLSTSKRPRALLQPKIEGSSQQSSSSEHSFQFSATKKGSGKQLTPFFGLADKGPFQKTASQDYLFVCK